MNITTLLTEPGSTTSAYGDTHFQSSTVYLVANSLSQVYSPVIIALGTFGNVMSLIIMSRLMSEESTINMFFMALAFGDLVLLYTGTLPNWAELFFDVRLVDKWCALYYLFWTASSASTSVSWFLVCVTLQRAMSVVWPHRVNVLCTKRRVSVLIAGIVVFMAILFSHHLFGSYVATRNAGFNCKYIPTLYVYGPSVRTVLYYTCAFLFSWLPFILLGVGNVVLVINLAGSVRMAGETWTMSQQVLSRKRAANSVTFTVLAMSLAFIVLTLPLSVYMILYYDNNQAALSTEDMAQLYLFRSVSTLLTDTNSAVNFYLYCLTGRRFRQEFVKIMCCRSTKSSSKCHEISMAQ